MKPQMPPMPKPQKVWVEKLQGRDMVIPHRIATKVNEVIEKLVDMFEEEGGGQK